MSEVVQDAPTSASESDVLDKIEAQLFGDEPSDEAQQPESPVEQDTEVDDDSVTVDDLATEDEPEPVTTQATDFEMTYNGETLKVDLGEAKNLAQLGYHLKQQQDKVAAEFQAARDQAAKMREFVEQQAKALPELRQADIEATALGQQLQNIDQNALARLAADDPAQYVQIRAQIDQLQTRFQSAVQRRNVAMAQYQQADKGQQETLLANEASLLQKLSPVFKDTNKAQGAIQQIGETLKGMRQETVKAVSHNAELMALALDAAKYRTLQASKRDKIAAVKAPARPGPGTTPMKANTADYLTARKAMKSAKTSSAKNESILRMLESKF